MSKVTELKNHVQEIQEANDERDNAAFAEALDSVDITPEALQELKDEFGGKQVEVVEVKDGKTATTTLGDYVKEVSNFQSRLNNRSAKLEAQKNSIMESVTKELSLIVPTYDKSVAAISQQADMLRGEKITQLVGEENQVPMETLNEIIDRTFATIGATYGTKPDRNCIYKFIDKHTPVKIIEIIPVEFFENFMPDYQEVSKMNFLKFKNNLLSILNLLLSVGPEMDELQKYIEDANRSMEIFMKLSAIQCDIADLIESDNPAGLVERFIKMHPDLNTSYKIGENDIYPDKVKRVAAQKCLVYELALEKYRSVLTEYEGDEIALNVINGEIAEAEKLVAGYTKGFDMANFLRYMESYMQKDIKKDHIKRSAQGALDACKQLKFQVAFPGYVGNEKTVGAVIENATKYLGIVYKTHNMAVENSGVENPELLELNEETIYGHMILLMVAIERYIHKTKKGKEPKDYVIEMSSAMAMVSSLIGDVNSVRLMYDTFEMIMARVK